MAHVIQRVINLRWTKWSVGPVRNTFVLREVDSEYIAQQLAVSDRVSITGKARGGLRVHDVLRELTGKAVHEIEILIGRVQDDEDVRTGNALPKRIQIAE